MAIPANRLASERPKKINYPESDGKPMGETILHAEELMNCAKTLQAHFSDRPDVLVCGDVLLYYEEGNPKKVVVPDVFVVFGVVTPPSPGVYKVWEEGGRTPDVAFEFTSKKTKDVDIHKKPPLYEQILRISEYFQFDPTGDYLKPRLQGFRLMEGRYARIEEEDGRLYSERLRLVLGAEDETMRFYSPETGERLPTPVETARLLEEMKHRTMFLTLDSQEQRRQKEAAEQRAESAEEEIRRLREELETLRKSG